MTFELNFEGQGVVQQLGRSLELLLVEESAEPRHFQRKFQKESPRTCLKVMVGDGWPGVCGRLWEDFLIHPRLLMFPR